MVSLTLDLRVSKTLLKSSKISSDVTLVLSSLLLKVVCSLLQLLQLLGILRFQVLQLLLVVSARNSVPLNFLASLLELLLELQVLLGSFTLDT